METQIVSTKCPFKTVNTYITPKIAKGYLDENEHLEVKEETLDYLTERMKTGNFIANGQSIIFDKGGNLIDGLGRLKAIAKSKQSFWIPIVTNVSELSADTINRVHN